MLVKHCQTLWQSHWIVTPCQKMHSHPQRPWGRILRLHSDTTGLLRWCSMNSIQCLQQGLHKLIIPTWYKYVFFLHVSNWMFWTKTCLLHRVRCFHPCHLCTSLWPALPCVPSFGDRSRTARRDSKFFQRKLHVDAKWWRQLCFSVSAWDAHDQETSLRFPLSPLFHDVFRFWFVWGSFWASTQNRRATGESANDSREVGWHPDISRYVHLRKLMTPEFHCQPFRKFISSFLCIPQTKARHSYRSYRQRARCSGANCEVRRQVMKGLREKTSGGLTKENLTIRESATENLWNWTCWGSWLMVCSWYGLEVGIDVLCTFWVPRTHLCLKMFSNCLIKRHQSDWNRIGTSDFYSASQTMLETTPCRRDVACFSDSRT